MGIDTVVLTVQGEDEDDQDSSDEEEPGARRVPSRAPTAGVDYRDQHTAPAMASPLRASFVLEPNGTAPCMRALNNHGTISYY